MSIRVVGNGKMGALHKAKLEELGHSVVTIDLDPDASADYLSQAPEEIPVGVGTDAAVIAVPAAEIVSEALLSIEAGIKRILVEKPIALSVADAEHLLAEANDAGAEVAVNFTERANPAVQVAAVSITRLGQLQQVELSRLCLDPERETAGPRLDLSLHDFDILRYCGLDFQPVSVEETAETFRATGASSSGAAIEVVSNYLTDPSERKAYFLGSDGLVEIDFQTQDIWFDGNRFEPPLGISIDPLTRTLRSWLNGEPTCLLADGIESLRLALATEAVPNA